MSSWAMWCRLFQCRTTHVIEDDDMTPYKAAEDAAHPDVFSSLASPDMRRAATCLEQIQRGTFRKSYTLDDML